MQLLVWHCDIVTLCNIIINAVMYQHGCCCLLLQEVACYYLPVGNKYTYIPTLEE